MRQQDIRVGATYRRKDYPWRRVVDRIHDDIVYFREFFDEQSDETPRLPTANTLKSFASWATREDK